MTRRLLPVTVGDVMSAARAQITHPTGPKPGGRWDARCQQFVRTCYQVDAWALSAIDAWHATPDHRKNPGGRPKDAPRGALLYFDIGDSGHVLLAAGIRTHTLGIGNDYIRQGYIDYCPRNVARWGATYLGWSPWTPAGSLRLE